MRLGANKILFLAVLGSVAVHIVLASIGKRVLYLPGWTIPDRHGEFTVSLLDKIENAEKPEKPKPSELDEKLLLGEANATGYASFAAPGLREQLARQADTDQAFLSRDPRGVGTGGESTAAEAAFNAAAPPPPPSEYQANAVVNEPVFGPVSPMPLPKAARPQEAIEAPPKVEVARANSTAGPLPVSEQEPPKTDDPKDVRLPTEEPRPAIAAPAPPPAPPQPTLTPAPVAKAKQSADPAPQTESEVDPFSTLGSVDFREGSLSVRAGREIKPRRPKFTLAGQVALLQVQSARVELAVTTDAAGRVTSTEILKSSGSVDIDQPVRVAMYDWWFEPKKNANGQPVPDRFKFVVGFR